MLAAMVEKELKRLLAELFAAAGEEG